MINIEISTLETGNFGIDTKIREFLAIREELHEVSRAIAALQARQAELLNQHLASSVELKQAGVDVVTVASQVHQVEIDEFSGYPVSHAA